MLSGGKDNYLASYILGILFKNQDPHVMLSGGKDNYLYQHVLYDAKKPAQDLILSGVDLSVYGLVGHASKVKRGKSLRNEPPHGKTNNLHRRKQRRRSASR